MSEDKFQGVKYQQEYLAKFIPSSPSRSGVEQMVREQEREMIEATLRRDNENLNKVQIPINIRVDKRMLLADKHNEMDIGALGTFNMLDLKRFLIPVIKEAFKETSANFEPEDMYNPNFMNLLLSEFNKIKALVDGELRRPQPQSGWGQPIEVGATKANVDALEIALGGFEQKLMELEKNFENPHLMLDKALENFKIKEIE